MSYELLKKIMKGGEKLTWFLENKEMLDEFGGTDPFIAGILKLIAKGFLNLIHEYDEDEGDDFKIELTEAGKAFISYKEKIGEVS